MFPMGRPAPSKSRMRLYRWVAFPIVFRFLFNKMISGSRGKDLNLCLAKMDHPIPNGSS